MIWHLRTTLSTIFRTLAVAATAPALHAQDNSDSPTGSRGSLPNHQALKRALTEAVAAETSGLDLEMWAVVVDRDGVVCAVAFSGADRHSQWPAAG